MIRHLVIFGVTGDLTARYLLPALARLHECGKLREDFRILGVGRNDWDASRFQKLAREALQQHAAEVKEEFRAVVAERLDYVRSEVNDRSRLASALPLEEPIAAYLALPPAVFIPAIETLAEIGVAPGSRIVVEKPFGHDLASAQELNRLLHKVFPEQAIFRIDHFLGMHTVQNIVGLRFGNQIFEPLWNRTHIQRVEIVWDETLTLEGRASYYDQAGALQDMVQNHLLQLLCLIGMEPPLTLGERDFRDRKMDLLRAVRRLSPEEVARCTTRARYSAGRIGERGVPAYVEEARIDPARETETFAQVSLTIDNWRWAGVPFLLRSGKALGKDRREIVIHFQPVPHLTFGEQSHPCPNQLRLELEPDRVHLHINASGRGDLFQLHQLKLDADLAPQSLPAYARLLLDVLEGDPTLAIRADEAEESWRIMDPILEVWKRGGVPLLEYPAGSEGPDVPS